MKVYPLKFKPILKKRLWGGEKLRGILGKQFSGGEIGESWEVSGVKGDISIVENGPYKGKSLQDLINDYTAELLGADVMERFGTEFPILIKFIDAQKDLSIQLHPDDELARKRHGSFGKTEMWYVMDADPGSELIIGFKRDMSPEEYQNALVSKSLPDYLNYETVEAGDTFFINSGKIHAIGAGILLAEIQQSSDVTYRVYDFDRVDADGNARELHTEQALAAMDFQRKDDFKVRYQRNRNSDNLMVGSEYFNTSYLELDADIDLEVPSGKSFTILICVNGQTEVVADSGKVSIQKGETLLIPAASQKVYLQTTQCQLLRVSL